VNNIRDVITDWNEHLQKNQRSSDDLIRIKLYKPKPIITPSYKICKAFEIMHKQEGNLT